MMTRVYLALWTFLINGSGAKQYTCSPDHPEFVWPLYVNTGVTEIMTRTTQGLVGNVFYVPATPDDETARSSAIEFTGENDSFVALHVPLNIAFLDDYTIQFYAYFIDVSAGTILLYESYVTDSAEDIESLQISVLEGDIIIEIADYGSVKYQVGIRPGEWAHFMYERDFSKDEVKFYVNRTSQAAKYVSSQLYEKPTKAPGILYLGGNSNSAKHFTGRFACLQIIPCKSTTSLKYDNYCKNSSDIDTEGSVNTSTTPIAGTSVSAAASTTTDMTGSTAGSPTATTGSTTITLPVASSSSTTAPTEVLTTRSLTPLGILSPIQSIHKIDVSVWNSCSHFTLIYKNVTFSNPEDVIDTAFVTDIVSCTRHCNKSRSCFSFTILPVTDGYICHTGPDSPDLTTQEGSVFYKRKFK